LKFKEGIRENEGEFSYGRSWVWIERKHGEVGDRGDLQQWVRFKLNGWLCLACSKINIRAVGRSVWASIRMNKNSWRRTWKAY